MDQAVLLRVPTSIKKGHSLLLDRWTTAHGVTLLMFEYRHIGAEFVNSTQQINVNQPPTRSPISYPVYPWSGCTVPLISRGFIAIFFKQYTQYQVENFHILSIMYIYWSRTRIWYCRAKQRLPASAERHDFSNILSITIYQ